jgi:hypothetical protein
MRHYMRYRHAYRAWVGVCNGHFVTMLVSGPVA